MRGSTSREGTAARLHGVRVAVTARAADRVSALLFELGAGGVEERARPGGVTLVAYAASRRQAEAWAEALQGALRAALPSLSGRRRSEPEAGRRGAQGAGSGVELFAEDAGDWESRFTEHLTRVAVTGQVTLRPVNAAEEAPAPCERDGAGRRVIRLDRAVSFGFGDHPTTRLAARALEECCRRLGARSVLDVGTGTGVLALVALCSGAERASACDLDPRALSAARTNARLNALAERLEVSEAPVDELAGSFDVVVANIDARTCMALAAALSARTAPGGTLLLTGFLGEDVEAVGAALRAQGMTPTGRLVGDEEAVEWLPASGAPSEASEWALLRCEAAAAPRSTRGG